MLAPCARWSLGWILKSVCTVIKRAKSIIRTRDKISFEDHYVAESIIELSALNSSVVYAPLEISAQFEVGMNAHLELIEERIYPTEIKLELTFDDDYKSASLVEVGYCANYDVFWKSSVEIEKAAFALKASKMIELLKKIEESEDA